MQGVFEQYYIYKFSIFKICEDKLYFNGCYSCFYGVGCSSYSLLLLLMGEVNVIVNLSL